MKAAFLFLAACGFSAGRVRYRIADDVSPLNAARVAFAVSELNSRVDCDFVSLKDDPSAPTISFVDPKVLIGEDAAGDYDPVTKNIRLTDYEKNPFLVGDVTFGGSHPHGKLDDSALATSRLSLHELGHAMSGFDHDKDFPDIMWPDGNNFSADLTDAVWAQYLQRLHKAGVNCDR